jgi:hypothetical protein
MALRRCKRVCSEENRRSSAAGHHATTGATNSDRDGDIAGSPATAARSDARSKVLLLCSIHHMLADGIHALVYPLLPVIAAELGLNYA